MGFVVGRSFNWLRGIAVLLIVCGRKRLVGSGLHSLKYYLYLHTRYLEYLVLVSAILFMLEADACFFI